MFCFHHGVSFSNLHHHLTPPQGKKEGNLGLTPCMFPAICAVQFPLLWGVHPRLGVFLTQMGTHPMGGPSQPAPGEAGPDREEGRKWPTMVVLGGFWFLASNFWLKNTSPDGFGLIGAFLGTRRVQLLASGTPSRPLGGSSQHQYLCMCVCVYGL